MAQPPSPHAITGSLSLPGNLPRSSGLKTTWPGDPRAGSDMTLYGPGIAFGAPSSGSVVLTRSALGPGAWANETHAVRTHAVVSADFMRCSLIRTRSSVKNGKGHAQIREFPSNFAAPVRPTPPESATNG